MAVLTFDFACLVLVTRFVKGSNLLIVVDIAFHYEGKLTTKYGSWKKMLLLKPKPKYKFPSSPVTFCFLIYKTIYYCYNW